MAELVVGLGLSNSTGETLSNSPLLPAPARPQPMPQEALPSARTGRQICVRSARLLHHNLDLQVAIWTPPVPGNVELLPFLWLKAHFQNVITGSAAGPGFLFPPFLISANRPTPQYVYCFCYCCGCCFNLEWMTFRSNFKTPPLPMVANQNSVFPNSLSVNHC